MHNIEDFLRKVSDYIHCHHLLSVDSKYIIALSGGSDSVALLRVLLKLGYNVEAAHCNFNLRGEESNRDEQFCVQLCEQYGVTLHRIHFDTYEYANIHKLSIEMAARTLRYDYFERLRNDIHADGICVAHHRDDSVETLLINLVRGSGIHGLTGIKAQNGFVLRPLLCVSRQEITDFLNCIEQDYVTDSSNLLNDVVRNKIRLDVMPLLEEINPAVKENIAKTAQRISTAADLLDKYVEKDIQWKTINDDIKEFPISSIGNEYLLWYLLNGYGFSPSQIEQIYLNLSANCGTEWISTTHRLIVNRGKLLLQPFQIIKDKNMRIPEVGKYVFSEECVFIFSTETIGDDFQIDKTKDRVCLDADKISFPLCIRYAKVGDRFYPYGMNGSKLLSDYMTDKKMSLFAKRKQMVITDANGQIIWLVNERADNRFCITSSTSKCLRIALLS